MAEEANEAELNDGFTLQSETSSTAGCSAGNHLQNCEKSACVIILTKLTGIKIKPFQNSVHQANKI